MTIETKYNIGDEMWFIWENKVQHSCITHVLKTSIKNFYEFDIIYNKHHVMMAESDIFPTKEELLKSL